MRLPRNLSGKELCKSLTKIGYEITRQKGSHIRLTSKFPKEHHLTIPNHDPIKIGTLSSIIGEIAAQRNQTKDELVNQLFG
jgi:predicted RNA binding protein YcfA (HicA-like mRNA interferase family)